MSNKRVQRPQSIGFAGASNTAVIRANRMAPTSGHYSSKVETFVCNHAPCNADHNGMAVGNEPYSPHGGSTIKFLTRRMAFNEFCFFSESGMLAPKQTPSPYRNWKVKQYTVSLETRLAQERARRHQPPLMSLHAKNQSPLQENEGVLG